MARLLSSLFLLFRVNSLSVLLLLYLLFVLLGATVFWAVEQPLEKELRARAEEAWSSFLQENPCVEERRLREVLRRALSAHHSDVPVLKEEEEEEEEERHGFRSSLYFVIVTLTTMGSDSYTPKSDEAKLFCIFYCTLGIPVTLFLLSLLSRLLLSIFSLSPLHHLHLCGVPHAQAALLHAGLLSTLLLCLLFLLPALLVSVLEPSWSFLDALFFCFLVLSTVGPAGDALGRSWSPGAREALELLTTCYLVVGLVVLVTCKHALLQVPQVCAVLRLLSGPQYAELEGFQLNELTESDGEEEHQYSQSVCTVSSTCSDLQAAEVEPNGSRSSRDSRTS